MLAHGAACMSHATVSIALFGTMTCRVSVFIPSELAPASAWPLARLTCPSVARGWCHTATGRPHRPCLEVRFTLVELA